MDDSLHKGRLDRYLAIGIVVIFLAGFGLQAWGPSRAQGSVNAQTVGEEYVSTPCEVRSIYDGKKWTVTGVVVPRDPRRIPFIADPNEYFTLSGGTYASDGRGCPEAMFTVRHEGVEHEVGFRPFREPSAYRVDLMLHWDDSVVGVAEVGSTITVTCRLKLKGFGLNDGDGGSISGSNCMPMEPDGS